MRRVHEEATKCVVFIGRQRNAWEPTGWVGTECVIVFIERAWTEQPMETRPGVPQNGGNDLVFDRPWSKRDRVHWEGLDGIADGNEACRTAERRKRPCVRPATFETGSCSSGGVWHTAKRRKRTSYGQNGGPVDREGCGIPQNGGNGLVLERYGRNGGPVDWEGCGVPQNRTPRDPVHLHGLPSTSSSLHRALLHRLLFNHPSTGTPPPSTVHPALHTTGSCSTTPPRPPLYRLLFIQPSTPRGPVHPEATPPLTVHPNPPTTLIIHQAAASIGFS